MRLTEEAFEDFKKLWKEDHPGQEMKDENRLREIATCIMRNVEIVYKPIHKSNLHILRQMEKEHLELYKEIPSEEI